MVVVDRGNGKQENGKGRRQTENRKKESIRECVIVAKISAATGFCSRCLLMKELT